jgi:hypothetical protein
MVTRLQQKTPHTIKIEFCDEPVTSFGGLILAERMAQRLGLWKTLEGLLPSRRGTYDWATSLKSLVLGLLSGSQGTYATQGLREDKTLLKMLSLDGAPEEATLWRLTQGLGELQADGTLGRVQGIAARRVLEKARRPEILLEGFAPVFGDGSLLEGSARREGTKYIKDKGEGLMLTTLFVGPVLAGVRLAGPGEGEASCLRSMLEALKADVLKPTGLAGRALMLVDSLHGDGPTLSQFEDLRLHYVAGVNKLKAAVSTLTGQGESQWTDEGARPELGWSASGVCVCWLQCADWPQKRLMVGRRWMKEGEMIWNYAGVATDLREKHVRGMLNRGLSFAQAIWRLYDAKAGMETLYQDGLADLGLHHPPCQEYQRNNGFYASAALAWLLGTAVDLIGGQSPERGNPLRQDGQPRKRPTPRRMRLWRLRRELLTVPGRIARHAHRLNVQLLGLSSQTRQTFDLYWANICRC